MEIKEQKDKVDSTHPDYNAWMADSLLTRSLINGTKGMRAAGETFLPRFELETQARYSARLGQSVLLNAFRKTVMFLSGQVFQSRISFADDFPEQLEPLISDADMLGVTADVFMRRIFNDGISTGPGHILVDVSGDTIGDTRQDEIDSNVRPYFRQILASDIIGWQTDGAGNLTQIRISESVAEPVGRYGEIYIDQIRVLTPGQWQLFRKDDGKYSLNSDGETNLDYIPLVTFFAGDPTSLMTCESPLQDLANLNEHHWQSSSDQKNILHIGRLPILYGGGIDLDKFVVGSSKAITGEADSSLQFVEIKGTAIKSGADDLKETESAMALYGLQQMIPRSGNLTATEKALTSAESNSQLSSWVIEFEDALTNAFKIAGEYIGVEVPKDSISMPADFDKFMANPQMITVLLDAAESGIISKEEAFESINQMGILREGVTWEVILDQTENEKRTTGTGALSGLTGLFNQT